MVTVGTTVSVGLFLHLEAKPGRETRYEGTKTAEGFKGTVTWPPGTYGPRNGEWIAKRVEGGDLE